MALELYHYVHCPFCVRVRMALGLFNLPYISEVLAYDDEVTPVNLTGKKMLPILQDEETVMNESLDIILYLDKKNQLDVKAALTQPEYQALEIRLSELGSLVHSLAMPYWVGTPEFNDQSRDYFIKKKSFKRGPFPSLIKNQSTFLSSLTPLLEVLEKDLNPFYRSGKIGLYDILIASQLWGLYVVPEFRFSEKVHNYLQRVKTETSFNYHQDFWS